MTTFAAGDICRRSSTPCNNILRAQPLEELKSERRNCRSGPRHLLRFRLVWSLCISPTQKVDAGFRSVWKLPAAAPDPQRALDLLVEADIFEQVIQKRYLGTKRFSLEGVTALIPFLDEVLNGAAERGAEKVVMAMSHRGRLNVMVNTLGKSAVRHFFQV